MQLQIQIHLMLLFIIVWKPSKTDVSIIQIHLMLLFIMAIIFLHSIILNSNTSHVIIYPKERLIKLKEDAFKYISCYYLSWNPRTILCLMEYSNTSHVIIYLYQSLEASAERGIQIHLMLLFIHACHQNDFLPKSFKYISCYYLS